MGEFGTRTRNGWSRPASWCCQCERDANTERRRAEGQVPRDQLTVFWLKARDGIRQHLLDGKLKPGDVLPVNVMAREFDTTRQTVVKALRALADDGLAEYREDRRWHVAESE